MATHGVKCLCADGLTLSVLLRACSRLLFTVVLVLFGAAVGDAQALCRFTLPTRARRVTGVMNIGAAVGFVQDRQQRLRFVTALQSPEVGFRTSKDGALWLWRFRRASSRAWIRKRLRA
jgi:hypothetical protein